MMQKLLVLPKERRQKARAALLNCISALVVEILKSPLHWDVSSILNVLPQVLLIAFMHVL